MIDDKPYTFDRVVRIALTAGLICGLIWCLEFLSDVLIPFFVAVLLAYLFNPLVTLIQKKINHRAASVLISLFLVACLALAAAMILIPMIMSQIARMGVILSQVATNSEIARRMSEFLPTDLWRMIRDYAAREDVQAFFKTGKFLAIVESAARKLLPGMWGIIAGGANLVMGVVGLSVIGLYLIFLLMDYQIVRQGWKDLLPDAYKEPLVEFVYEFDSAMNRYFRAQATVASIVGVLFAVGFSLIGLPMGILLGLFIGLLNMVPYLQMIGLIPAFFMAVMQAVETGTSLWMILGLVGLVFFVVQLIQDAFLVPRIMGKVTGLSPAIILLSLSIWGKLLGVLGLLIALPMTCLIWAYYQRYLASNRIAAPETGNR